MKKRLSIVIGVCFAVLLMVNGCHHEQEHPDRVDPGKNQRIWKESTSFDTGG